MVKVNREDSMRYCIITVLVLFVVSGCSASTSQALRGEVGRSVAHAQLVAGSPDSFHDLPDGRRAFQWHKWEVSSQGGPQCLYTAYAVLDGQEHSLAAWEIVDVDVDGAGCPVG
jgi:hypothetical protein